MPAPLPLPSLLPSCLLNACPFPALLLFTHTPRHHSTILHIPTPHQHTIMTAVAQPAAEWLQLQQAALAKKSTFEGACTALRSKLELLREPQGAAVLARARTLLRTRYTQPAAWVAGRQLFQAAQQEAAASGDQEQQSRLAEYVQECNEFLGEAPEGSTAAEGGASGPSGPSTSGRGGYLFEGLMSSEAEQQQQQQQQQALRQLDLMDLLGSALGQQLAAAQAAAQEGGDSGAGSGGAEGDGQQQQPQEGQEAAQAAAPELPPDVLEAIERELDAIAVQIMEETGQQVPRAAPPASKRVVASLPREQLTAERLQQLGGADVRCPVCM